MMMSRILESMVAHASPSTAGQVLGMTASASGLRGLRPRLHASGPPRRGGGQERIRRLCGTDLPANPVAPGAPHHKIKVRAVEPA